VQAPGVPGPAPAATPAGEPSLFAPAPLSYGPIQATPTFSGSLRITPAVRDNMRFVVAARG
jgi:hypothetical protein